MKKELIICIVVVAIVIIGNVFTQNHTKQCVAIMDEQLLELKEEINKEEKDDKIIDNKIDETRTKWDEMQETLAYYIEHDELEKVETEVFLLIGQIEAREYKDTFAEIEKCLFILEHIKEKTALNIKNIF